ncbi:MAG: ABC transporter substrate-binding protein [Actinomycetota bacterium]|jgi:iron complex transport system substrate-binding protein
MPKHPVRRRWLALAAGALVLVSAACGNDRGRTPEPVAASGTEDTSTWSFTDDLGVTVTRDSRPTRIVAQVSAAATLYDYGIKPVGVFGPTVRKDGTPENLAGDLAQLGNLPSVGSAWGEFNLEQLAALKPDLIVTMSYEESLENAKYDPYWFVPKDSLEKIKGIAPIVAIRLRGEPLDHTVERFAELAKALGADMDGGANAAARSRFNEARDDFAKAIADKPGLTALFVAGYTESFYVANPEVAVDVAWFRELGLQVPDVAVADGEFWEVLSWEQAGRHAADVIFNDIRGQSLTVEEMKKGQPTFANLPAVKAGQVGRWHFESPYSYESVADVLADMTTTIRAANPSVVPS